MMLFRGIRYYRQVQGRNGDRRMNRKKAREIMREHQSGFVKLNPRWCAIDKLIEDSEKLELEERKKGKWITNPTKMKGSEIECNKCGVSALSRIDIQVCSDFCPNCGAEMESEE